MDGRRSPFEELESPTAEQVREARVKANRTQSQAAQVLRVSERQFQRWESVGGMPPEVWLRYKMTCGYRFPADFEIVEDGATWGYSPGDDEKRTTIEKGDRVHLQAINGTMIQARVVLDRVHDGLTDEDSYAGHVVDFPGRPEVGPEHGGFYLGERVTFAKQNVVHVEQRLPLRAPLRNSKSASPE